MYRVQEPPKSTSSALFCSMSFWGIMLLTFEVEDTQAEHFPNANIEYALETVYVRGHIEYSVCEV